MVFQQSYEDAEIFHLEFLIQRIGAHEMGVCRKVLKCMFQEVVVGGEPGLQVTKVCITALIDQTFHARLHCARQGVTDELVIDSRPSDALNLAIRYEAPIYINKAIADKMASPLASYESKEEVPSEVESMCREALKRYHDPTIVHKVNMQIAIEEDRFEDAAK